MKYKNLTIVFVCFTIYYILDDLYFKSFREFLNENIHNNGLSHNISYLLFGLPLFIGILILDKRQAFF